MDPSTTAASPPPEGALCAEHPHLLAVATCGRCGLFLCGDCAEPRAEGGSYCAACAARVEEFVVPWEERARTGQGLIAAWWETFKQICFRPHLAFAGVGKGPWAPAVSFGVIAYTVGNAVYMPMQTGLQALLALADPNQAEMLPFLIGWGIVVTLTLPLWGLLGVVLGSAMLHPFLRIFGGQGTFPATLRASGYAAAPQALYVVPCLGWAVGAGLWLVAAVYAQKHAHAISGWAVVGASVVMMAAFMLLFAGLAGALVFVASQAGGL